MRDVRFAVIAGLVVVEFAIVGAMFGAIGGGGRHGLAPFAVGSRAMAAQHSEQFSHAYETDAAPNVFVDDPGARVTVTARPGNTVTVDADSVRIGYVTDTSTLQVRHDAHSVRIERRSSHGGFLFGSLQRTLALSVPPGAHVEIAAAGSTDVTGLRERATLRSSNGVLVVRDHRGDLTASTRNGRIVLNDVTAPDLVADTRNGTIELDHVRSTTVRVETRNGRVEASHSTLRGGSISTRNGRVTLGLAPDADVTVSARTRNGKVSVASPLVLDGSQVRVGNGSGRLDVGSGNGPISISIEGV